MPVKLHFIKVSVCLNDFLSFVLIDLTYILVLECFTAQHLVYNYHVC